jgi:hypothetical protein
MRMIAALRRCAILIPAAAVLAMAADTNIETLRRSFENPPDDARIMMRWWWFGPGVTKAEIEREFADSEGCRSAFRTDVDHDSEVMPISVPN